MREIKFRAWDREIKKFIFFGLSKYLPDDVFDCDMPITQFTGLKDKNGKEIYEGDIIKVEALVVYERDGWDSKTGEYIGKIPHEQKINEIKIVEWRTDGFNLIHSNWVDWDFEVIGNIYENPELMEGEGKNEKNKR